MSYWNDPEDSRFADINPVGAAQDYYHPYPTQLDIGDDLESPHHTTQAAHAFTPGFLHEPRTDSLYSHSSYPSSSSNLFSEPRSRDISTDYTHPDLEPAYFVQRGKRCIFHWVNCKARADGHDDWVEHIDSHFNPPQGGSRSRREWGRMPTSWTCGFPNCPHVVNHDDHQTLWDMKLVHIYEHLATSPLNPEAMGENGIWMSYYYRMGLCGYLDADGFSKYPPTSQPFTLGYNEPRKMKYKKGLSKGPHGPDAQGEPVPPAHGHQPPYGQAPGNRSSYQPGHYYPPPTQHGPIQGRPASYHHGSHASPTWQ
ncbi:hypothetical protein ABW20_dc0102610 [Dactylellina cionopaga]|nr:hypothetical protein ABW20_dc0102610 [Dactylellina cionopaga]